jgi:transcriptional regulator with XRE-family HTH domain
VHSGSVENQGTPLEEDFAQILKRLKSEYGATDTEVAARIGVHVSTVNSWVHRKRAPRDEVVRTLAREYPRFSEDELFAALDRRTPGALGPDAAERILAMIRSYPPELQQVAEIQVRALGDAARK